MSSTALRIAGAIAVAEAAVVGYPHPIKGEAIYVYVIAMADQAIQDSDDQEAATKAVKMHVREALGPVAAPDLIQWVPGLPKTRSGKIMRRILRKIAADDFGCSWVRPSDGIG